MRRAAAGLARDLPGGGGHHLAQLEDPGIDRNVVQLRRNTQLLPARQKLVLQTLDTRLKAASSQNNNAQREAGRWMAFQLPIGAALDRT